MNAESKKIRVFDQSRMGSAVQLIKIFLGDNISIRINNQIPHFQRICKSLDRFKVEYETYSPLGSPISFDIHFGSKVDLQDLYIITTFLQIFGLQNVFLDELSGYDVVIGSAMGDRQFEDDNHSKMEVGEFLKIPFNSTIKDVIQENFETGFNKEDFCMFSR